MNFDKRKSGIRVIGDLDWGSHFCQFYQSKDDLLDMLLPYLKAGLDGNELCVLVAAAPLGAAAAKQTLQKAVPRFAEYAKQGRMEIVPYSRWMAAGGASGRAIVSRLNKARLLDLDGVRLAVCTLPPKKKQKTAACIGADTISRHNVIGMYAYPRDKFDAVGLMEAVKDHRAALVRNAGKWEVIESIQARTIRDQLKRSEERYRSLFGNMLHGFAFCKMLYDEAGNPVDFVYLEVNEEFGRLTGLRNVVGKKVTEAIPGITHSHPELFATYGRVARTGRAEKFEIEFRPLDRWLSISVYSPERDYFVAIFDNITDRKRTETILQETHDRMRAVLESIADGFFSVDAGWKFTYINRKAGSLWKRNPEELLGKSLWDLVPQAAGTVFEEQYHRCLAEQTPVSFEAISPITGKWVEVRAYPSREGLSVYFSDISERKRSEEALRENEKQFRTLADSIPNLAWWANSDGYITWYNQRWYEYTGTTPEQMQGWGWQSVHDPDVLPKVMERWKECLATGQPFDMEFPLRGADGVFRPFLTRVMPVKDAGGKVLRWFGTNTDVSERKQAEDALRESETKYRNLFENMVEEVHFWQLVRDENGHIKTWRLVDANPPTLKTWGRSSVAEIRGKTTDEIFGPGATDHYLPIVRKIMTEGMPYSFEDYFPNLGKHFRFTSVPLGDYFITTGTDITAVKKNETALLRLNKALKALSDSSQAVIRSDDEIQYLNRICRIIIADCGYTMAWIGFSENDAPKSVRPVAYAGFEEGYLETLNLTWADTERGQGPTGRAIRSGNIEVCPNMLTDPAFTPWRKEAIKRGYASSIVFPLRAGSTVFGAITIYSKEPDPFTKDEIRLLNELTDNVAYGIEVLRIRAGQEQAEKSLRLSEEKFSLAFANNPAAIALTRLDDGVFLDVNETWVALSGYSRDEAIGHSARILPVWPTPEAGDRFVHELREKGSLRGWVQEFRKKSGEHYIAQLSAQVLTVRGERVILSTMVDITERKRTEEALQRSMKRFELLARTSNDLLQTAEPQRAIEALCRKVMEHLGCHAFFNYLVDEKSGRLHLNACSGIPAEEAKRIEWLDFGAAVCGSVARDRTRIVAEHIPTTPDERTKLVSSYGIKAYACNPILGPAGRIIGTLSFGTCSRETFSEDDLSLMTVVTDQVAVAMIRMQDEQALRQAHDELERRVRERTAELAQANRELEQEIAVRTIAEKELRESEVRFRTSVESLLDGYAIFSPVISGAGRIMDFRFEYINEAGCRINGKSRNEHLGHTLLELFPSYVDAGLFSEYIRVVETGQPLAKSFISEDAHADGSRRARAFDLQAVKLGPGIAVVWRDVTEQKQVEEALRSANSYNRSLLEASLDPLVTIAVDGKITDVNEATVKVTGAAREKLIGTDFSTYFTEPRKAQEGYEQVFAKGFVTDYPLTIRHTDGRCTDVLYNASVYCDPQGRVMGVFAAARDVTEKRKTEEALRQASAYNRSLLEASLDPLVTISADGKITDVNIATETVTGYSRIDLIGTDFSDYFQDPDKARAGYQLVFREGSVKDYPLEIRHRDGRVTPVLYNATVYRDSAGKVIGVFAAARDITERRETERRTALTNELLKLYTRKFSRKGYLDVAVELIRDWSGCHHTGVRIADPGGNIPYESCVGYNPDFLETENRLSVKSDHCICTRVVVGTPESSERAMMTQNGSFYSNQTLRFVDNLSGQERGQYRGVCMRYGYTSLAVVPIRHGETILGAIHIADERPDMVPLGKVEFIEQLAFIIGEALFRFGIEEELRQLNRDLEERVSDRTAQLQSANKELEAFAYSVSHDLRTPLRSIDGFSHALLEDYASRLDETGRDYFERIRAAAAKMGQLIDALLNLSRVTRGELKRVPVNLSSLAQTVVDELRKSHPERTVQVRIAENMNLDADPIMMRVVLENLISNAWKFTGKRERAEIEVGFENRDERIVYFVRDNGAGFDMAYGNKLFSAFQRLHATNDFPGIGIGLATVQRIVHRHGGTIWAEGEVDKGAVVYFTLP